MCRPRHRHSTDNSPHSFRVRILAPSLCFVLPMDLFLGSQHVSTCFCLRSLMFRHLLVHDYKIGRAWRCAALGIDILRVTHLIPFVSLYSCTIFLFCNIDGSFPWSAARKYLLLSSLDAVSSSSGSLLQYWESVACPPSAWTFYV